MCEDADDKVFDAVVTLARAGRGSYLSRLRRLRRLRDLAAAEVVREESAVPASDPKAVEWVVPPPPEPRYAPARFLVPGSAPAMYAFGLLNYDAPEFTVRSSQEGYGGCRLPAALFARLAAATPRPLVSQAGVHFYATHRLAAQALTAALFAAKTAEARASFS